MPLTVSGILMMVASGLLVVVKPGTPYLFLAGSYLLVGFGFGMVNPPITNTAVSGMPLSQAGVAAAVAGTARQVGSVLGVAVLGSVVASRMPGELASRLAGSHLPAAVLAHLRKTNVGTGSLAGPGLPARAAKIVEEAFTASTHTGWVVASAAGLLIAVLALLTTGPRSQQAAKRVMRDAHEH
jgi:hypothetical protein